MSFSRHPKPLDAPLGDDVNFECNLNLAAERFSWSHRPLGSDKWLPVFPTSNSGGKTSRHEVKFDNETKAGDYRCIAFYGKCSSSVKSLINIKYSTELKIQNVFYRFQAPVV